MTLSARLFGVATLVTLLSGMALAPHVGAQTMMALGDSMTDGYPPPGYRKFLFETLKQEGFVIDNVGSKGVALSGPTFADLAHEGHINHTIKNLLDLRCGLRMDSIPDPRAGPPPEPPTPDTRPRISNYLRDCTVGRKGSTPWKAFSPAITLLMIGTNDFRMWDWSKPNPGQTIVTRLEELITAINPVAIDLFVATIPPIACVEKEGKCSSTWFTSTNRPSSQQVIDEQVAIYNRHILDLGSRFDNVFPVDMNSVLTLDDLRDALHPNVKAYEKIAAAWSQRIEEVLSRARESGDLNRDGNVDIEDLSILTSALNQDFPLKNDPRDLDGDGKITVLDARLLVSRCTVQPLCR